MNHVAMLLKTPWIASSRSSRWLALIVVLLCAATLAAVVHGMHGHDALIISALAWCAAIGCWCLLVVGNALFVARDSTALCLPSLRRVANASVIVHTLLFVLIPALALGALMGHWLVWLVGFSLAAVVCMLFLLLPSTLTFVTMMGVSLGMQLWHPHPLPKQLLPELAIVPTVLLAVLAAWLWRRLQRRDLPTSFGYNVPLIWALRLQQIHGIGALRADPDKLMARTRWSGFMPTPDLAGLGPARPARSIRVALGRSPMPQTWTSVARQVGLSLGILVVFTVLPFAAQMGNHDFRAIMTTLFLPDAGSLGMPVVIGCVVAALATVVFPATVRARWSAGSAELSLLALLPGLGDPAAARRHVLRAVLTQTLRAAVVEFVVLCALGAWVHALPGAVVFSALSVACTVAMAVVVIVGTVAARPLPRVAFVVLATLLPIVVGLAMACGFAAGGYDATIWWPLIAALAVLLWVTGWLCRRAWRAFVLRPHPFLAGAP